MGASVDFCGEIYRVDPEQPVVIGRDGDVTIDDNPYLHRRFLELSETAGLIWLVNIGSRLSATVADADGLMQAWVGPGARVPIVFPTAAIWFTAGPTTYELTVTIDDSPFVPAAADGLEAGETTVGRVTFTPDQRLLIIALAEEILRRGNRGAGRIPSSADAAGRLGWTITKFNRKLDNVCDKLTRFGVRGLHGHSSALASNRRARLVEYAIASRMITTEDLRLLDDAP